MARKDQLPVWKTMKEFLRPHAGLITVMMGGSLVAGVLQVITPLFQQYAINRFIAEKTLDGLTWFILAYALTLALMGLFHYLASYSCCKLEMFLLRDMRRATFNRLQTLSIAYFNRNGVGKIHARVMSDSSNIGSVLAWDVYEGIWNLAYIVGAIVVMLVQNALLACCVIGIVPFVALVSVYFQRKLTKLNREVREINSTITSDFNEGITGVETGKTLAAEERLDEEFFSHTGRMRKRSVRLGHHRALFTSVIAFASSVALALVLWYGGVITAEGIILVGTLSIFMTYAQGLMEPVQWSVDVISDIISVRVNLERITALLHAENDVTDRADVIETYGDVFQPKRENWEKLCGDVVFDDVSFRYPDGEELVLEHFHLTVPQGTNVAIVGETGAGKSTLVNLICRFYEPTSGRVLIDGRDARDRSLLWLHSQIGYVLQTPHLFSGTVRENLRYGKEDATEEEMWAALESVDAADTVRRLKDGLDSVVGESGNTFSVGEKQLLSFARAILSDPAIFILDEATSSVDTVTERRIQNAIELLMKGRTSFVIAHRLSTVVSADVILVVHEGKIVERGTHRDLLRRRGYYYHLYMKQFQEEQIENCNKF